MNYSSVINALIRSPRNLLKLVRLVTMMQRKQVDQINQLESYFFHPNYKCYIGGTSRISGVYAGWAAYRDKIILGEVGTPGKLLKVSTGKNNITLTTRLSGDREGKHLDQVVDFLFTFAENKIIEQRSVPSNDQQWSEFWEK